MTRPEAPARSDSFRPVLGATVLLVFALLAIAALKSYRDLEAARAREHQLETRIAKTKARSEKLRLRIDRLHHDPGMLERLAREDLGMVRPGDVVIELPDGAVAASPRPLAPAPSPIPPPHPEVTPELVGPPAPSPIAVPVSGPPAPD